jgi:O-antigen/teichoic acid export membrane protein
LQLTGVRMLLWMGHTDITSASRVLFAPLLWSSALLGISVTATYTLFAFQRVALVTTFSVLGAALCLLCMVWFGQRFGAVGVATARLVYGAASVILYVPLWRMLGDSGHRAHAFVPSGDEA